MPIFPKLLPHKRLWRSRVGCNVPREDCGAVIRDSSGRTWLNQSWWLRLPLLINRSGTDIPGAWTAAGRMLVIPAVLEVWSAALVSILQKTVLAFRILPTPL